MRRDREPPEVDFVVGTPDPTGDEDLPERPDREYALLRRLRKPVGVFAVLALVLLGVVKLATLSGSGTATAAGPSGRTPTSAPIAASLGAGVPVPPAPSLTVDSSTDVTIVRRPATTGGLISDGSGADACPDEDTCSTAYDVPSGVLAALRAAYPGATLVSAKSLLVVGVVDTTLMSRTVKARAGAREIDVQMLPYLVGPDSASHEASGGNTLVSALSTATGFTVDVTVIEPRSRRPSDRTALGLARDPRLLATT